MRTTRILATTIAAATLMAGAAGTAGAASGTTDTTVTLTSSDGALAVTIPDSSISPVDLGSTAVPSTAGTYSTSAFGSVTVQDTRAVTVGWVTTATSTDFCIDQSAGTAGVQCHATDTNQKILSSAVTYDPSTLTVDLGSVGAAAGVPGLLSSGATVTYTGTGNSTISWTPSLTFTLAATQVAGTYRGTITHSVS